MKTEKKFSILWFGQRWNKYRRRDVELISRLSRCSNVQNIILIEPPLPLTSIINLWRKNYDEDGRETWKRILKKGIIWQPEKGIWVGTPLVPILGSKHKYSCFYNITRKFIAKRILRRLNIQRLVLWIGSPYFTSALIGAFGEDLVCYSLCEDFSEKDSENKEMIVKEDEKISSKADLIFVVSEKLAQQHNKYQEKLCVVPNGVDVELITNIKNNNFSAIDTGKISKPIIGFVGGLNKNIDLDLIYYLAKKRPDWSIVMIGPLSSYIQLKIQKYSIPNLHFLGSKPFKLVPNYINKFDICILPYKENNRNEGVSSMKMYLYLALGKPIVGRPVADAELFNGIISVAGDQQSFLKAIETNLKSDNFSDCQKRIALAKKHSWNNRSQSIYSRMTRRVYASP